MRYILPQFSQGTVRFADKRINSGVLNISPIDQSIYCISSEKDTLYVAGYPDIVSVTVSGRFFIGGDDSFVEIVARHSDTGVGIIRTTSRIDNVKQGAYGMVSGSSSIKSYTVDNTTGIFHGTVSKKSFVKMFPERKEFIESVWNEHNISAAGVDAVIGVDYLKFLSLCRYAESGR